MQTLLISSQFSTAGPNTPLAAGSGHQRAAGPRPAGAPRAASAPAGGAPQGTRGPGSPAALRPAPCSSGAVGCPGVMGMGQPGGAAGRHGPGEDRCCLCRAAVAACGHNAAGQGAGPRTPTSPAWRVPWGMAGCSHAAGACAGSAQLHGPPTEATAQLTTAQRQAWRLRGGSTATAGAGPCHVPNSMRRLRI